MAINRFEFLHNDTVFGLSSSRAELDTIVPECGSNTDSTANTAGTRTASSTFTTSSTIKTPSSMSKTTFRSPYLATDKVHMVSRRTEKTCMQRTATNFMSSFPYAADIYKASSDQFRALKDNKRKPKKSVLTLPTQQAPMPQECTVSDMNESEYYRDEPEKAKPKRITQMKKKKAKQKKAQQKVIDRDMKYCRQFNIDLYCSSTDSTTKADFNELKPKTTTGGKTPRQQDPHDVWSVLRSINKFQFRPTPTSSTGSKRTKAIKKHRKDRERAVNSVFASCCTTEEFAYISTVDIKQDEECKKSNSSGITVINEHDKFARFCKRATDNVRQKLALKDIPIPNDKGTTHNATNKIAQVNARNTKRKVMLKYALINQKKDNFAPELNGKRICLNNNIISTKSSRDSMEFRNIIPLGVCDNSQKTYNSFRKNLSKGDEAMEFVEKQKDPLNDIIKVILHKGKDFNNVRITPPAKERKPRLVTTLVSAPYAPHLTKTEIRKQVYRLKYPIVVLGKEELTSAYYVVNNELSPQFGGLEKMSWPFMKEWYDIKENIKLEIKKDAIETKPDSKTKTKNNTRFKINKVIGTDIETLCKSKRENATYSKSQQSRKSICNLKDKVLEILSKKSATIKSNIQTLADKARSENNKKTTFGDSVKTTGTSADYVLEKASQSIPPAKPTICNLEVARIYRSPLGSPVRAKGIWCKAQGNNEFIDNVIQKVSAGVYYSHDKNKSFGYKEASIQTLGEDKKIAPAPLGKEETKKEKETSADLKYIYKYDTLNAIGFDEVVSGLEIESLNESQIAVKHCITNIVIHFDVTVLPLSTNVLVGPQVISCKPLHNTIGPTKAFKCDSILINDMLPAEICTVMPKMMRDILRSLAAPTITSDPISIPDNIMACTPDNIMVCNPDNDIIPRKLANKLQTLLPVISEMINTSHVPPAELSNEVLKMIDGNFKVAADHALFKPNIDSNVFEVSRRSDLLKTPKTWLKVRAMPMIKQKQISSNFKYISTINNMTNARTELQPYIRRESRLISYDEYTLSTMAHNIIDFFMGQPIYNTNSYLYPLLNTILDRQLSMHIELESSTNFAMLKFDQAGVVDRITNNIEVIHSEPVIIIDYVNSDITTHDVENNGCTLESIEAIEKSDHEDAERGELKSYVEEVAEENCKELPQKCDGTIERVKHNKTKKKFVKLYRKCNSTTNVSDKSATPLVKINSIEDFFQALGPDKSLANVFDGAPGQIILDCIKEMRSWISEITPKQALLVLLLTNKKETPSLKRFRLIILQAIAVNRITRASELDMEIEVIEREKFQINTDVANHSWMKDSTHNDVLLEELCWIAKTTASDYQRPFDESSETLLKSLIEKRKQLNPSYLRVMARYVGLGLLTTQTKN